MMSYLIESAAEMLKLRLDSPYYSIETASDAQPPPTSPDIYLAIHEAGFNVVDPSQDALAVRLRFRVTISVRAPEYPMDRPDEMLGDHSRNVMKIAEKVAFILHQERWNVVNMANDKRPQGMNGIVEPFGLMDLGETANRNGKWWGLGEESTGLVGASRSVLFGNALWQTAQPSEPEPEDALQ
jgi:hypothetical protein